MSADTPDTLTEQEREALRFAFVHYHPDHDEGSRVYEVVEALVAARVAAAEREARTMRMWADDAEDRLIAAEAKIAALEELAKWPYDWILTAQLRTVLGGDAVMSADTSDVGLTERERLGRLVREVWIEWAREQPDPKPSWLVEWDDLPEPDREVDRRIGERLVAAERERIAQDILWEPWERWSSEKPPSADADEQRIWVHGVGCGVRFAARIARGDAS